MMFRKYAVDYRIKGDDYEGTRFTYAILPSSVRDLESALRWEVADALGHEIGAIEIIDRAGLGIISAEDRMRAADDRAAAAYFGG